jgi:hypothetical protein
MARSHIVRQGLVAAVAIAVFGILIGWVAFGLPPEELLVATVAPYLVYVALTIGVCRRRASRVLAHQTFIGLEIPIQVVVGTRQSRRQVWGRRTTDQELADHILPFSRRLLEQVDGDWLEQYEAAPTDDLGEARTRVLAELQQQLINEWGFDDFDVLRSIDRRRAADDKHREILEVLRRLVERGRAILAEQPATPGEIANRWRRGDEWISFAAAFMEGRVPQRPGSQEDEGVFEARAQLVIDDLQAIINRG